jgi:preprotein translocase subunit SecB
MKQSPLQLLDYWVDYIEVRANPNFDSSKEIEILVQSIDLVAEVSEIKIDDAHFAGTAWQVSLRIEQPLPEGKNLPYSYKLDIAGLVAAHPGLKDEQLKRAVEVNGPSMLFGSAREIIRAATSRGRHAPVIIPSTNFFSPAPAAAEVDKPALPAQSR